MQEVSESLDQFDGIEAWTKLGISIGIFLIFLLLRKVFTTYIFKFFLRIAEKRKVEFAANLMLAIEQPVRWLIVLIGVIISLHYFPIDTPLLELRSKIYRSFFVFLFFWTIFNISSSFTTLFPKLVSKFGLEVDQIVMPFFTKIIKLIIIAFGASIIAEEWGFNVDGFVAGLGLGGLAFALAAKDTVSNFFGGIVIVTEKPFTIGDWVKTPSVEGTIEDITFRSTKVRTFAQALVTVPNATLSNEPIINWSKMGKRQIAFHLGVNVTTPKEKLENVIKDIERMLIDHPEVHPETILVKFDEFSHSGFNLYLYFFTKATDFGGYLSIKEDVNFKIMEILEQEDVQIAIPSQAFILQKDSNMEAMNDFESMRD
ncbi:MULTISPECIES: mechanosensitive ion channel family protein [Peribacillus]|uniref:mechanosensitive ion channel family protein n=1 Tax=Peribacillus TaxID=2675229 RepID=UPI001F4EBF74|nr:MULTISPECIES: mechanosensitive ion channel family protein [unclassified Peribacillus]MCK1982718.1 mechanosensitive ion channel family protein [Peribacillus sp. Aquil_B1]MCK2010352.1 mechanosensitive ion channel family protein [Peribacillus sp. Aquil_B8]